MDWSAGKWALFIVVMVVGFSIQANPAAAGGMFFLLLIIGLVVGFMVSLISKK